MIKEFQNVLIYITLFIQIGFEGYNFEMFMHKNET